MKRICKLSNKGELEKENKIINSHPKYWTNLPSLVLRRRWNYSRSSLRILVHDEHIKGGYTPEILNIDRLVKETKAACRLYPHIDNDIFKYVEIGEVIPWMGVIVGCHIYALGRGASIVANPSNIAPKNLPGHLKMLLHKLEDNVWCRKLQKRYRQLAKVLGDKYPFSHTLMRGPGDMSGVSLGPDKFIRMMIDRGSKNLNIEFIITVIRLETAS